MGTEDDAVKIKSEVKESGGQFHIGTHVYDTAKEAHDHEVRVLAGDLDYWHRTADATFAKLQEATGQHWVYATDGLVPEALRYNLGHRHTCPLHNHDG